MAHTKSSKRIWQEVRAKVKAERMKEVYPYMYMLILVWFYPPFNYILLAAPQDSL